ncbi:TPA: type III secretion system needle length determinant [Aeromonas hydrophila]|uniref:Type III secretion system needle length determinant n=1 Tax=Aeromonas hydrophila TaxID=644 RepID=A0AAD3UBU9_AERHY|nr:type III secretion system needle length determinant [Aeromonas hydrophila]
MNRLTAPRADTKIACEQHSLQREANKADPAQQQRFEQALLLESASQKVRDQKRVPGRQEQERRSKPDAPLSNSKAANKEAELAERKLARPAPHAKAPHGKQERSDWQESQQPPATSPQLHEGMLAPTTQQERETAQAEQSRRLPSDITSSPELLAAAERDGIYENAADLPLTTVSNEILSRLQLSDSNKLQELGELATRPEIGEQLQTEDEPIELAPVASEEELLARENFAGSAIRVPPLATTPGDLLLARVTPSVNHHELGQLISRLAVEMHLELGRLDRPPLLQLSLPALGELTIRIERHQGMLQVEMQASEQGSQLLNQGRSELIERLQRLYPGERVAVDLFTQGDSEQGSRQKRSIYDEWDADA